MKQDLKANPKIKLGNVAIGISDDDFLNPKNQKIRVTMFIDCDIYSELKKRADVFGGKYQTMLNQLLREAVFPKEAKNHPKAGEVNLDKFSPQDILIKGNHNFYQPR